MTNTEFEQFIEKNKNGMYRFAFSILRNHEDAKDVVQEVVLELCKKKTRLDRIKKCR
jgi:DNA-directed RNA polymerase specialized sigma24 family protein